MRSISERRHFDACAVQRQLRLVPVFGRTDQRSPLAKQPHRLHKTNLIQSKLGSGHSANPRKWPVNAKERMTLGERASIESFLAIEITDLLDQIDLELEEQVRRNASCDERHLVAGRIMN